MNAIRHKLAISMGLLAASGLLSLMVPTGTGEATFWKPPMPCVAVQAGLYPVGAGLCPGPTGRIEWSNVEPERQAGSGGVMAQVRPMRMTPSPSSEPPQAEDLREIERERLDALVDADVATAGALMGDDFEVIQPLGDLLSRDEYLGDVGSGALDYLVFEPISEIEVRLFGDAAAMRYRGHVQVVVQGLGEIDQELWYTLIYELRDGQWLAVWEQRTGVGGTPLPPADTAG